MANLQRPLSPHLQIYRWPLAMAISILHRVTGVALAVGAVLMVVLLVSIAAGSESYGMIHSLLSNIVGKTFILLWTFALFLHLFNGIRHLFWDAGYGFEKSTTLISGVVVLLATVALTTAVWVTAYISCNV